MAPATRPIQTRLASPGRQRIALIVLCLCLAGAVLAANIASYLPFLADDALISLQYSQRLLQGKGLTWTDGSQPVEGYSNLLWVLMAAALGSTGLDLVTASRILGVAGVAAAMLAFLYRFSGPRGAPGALAGMLAVALSGPAAAWAIGGLEQPLVLALLAWALVLIEPFFTGEELSPRRWLLAGGLYGLLALTRPDGILFAGMGALAVFVARGFNRRGFRGAFLLALLPVLFYLAQLAFRLAYYGEWVPNTALVKVSLSRAHLRDGLLYLQQGLLSMWPLAALALAAALAFLVVPVRRGLAVLYIFTGGAWLAYVALVGGDIFPAWRHLAPVVILIALLVARLADWLAGRLKDNGQRVLAGAALAALLAGYGYLQAVDPENQRAREERWEWDGKVVGLALKTGFGAQAPLLAVEPGGCIPFWSQLPSIDMLGLNDYYIPRHPPQNFGQGWIGHELGDGPYVLSRQPDMVLFCLPGGSADPCFTSGKQMTEDPSFYEHYTLVNFQAGKALYGKPRELVTRLWVRREGGRTGIQRAESEINIPAYLFSADHQSAAALDSQGRWFVTAAPGAPLWLKDVNLPPGTWTIRVESTQPAIVSAFRSGASTLLAENAPVTISGNTARVDLKIAADSAAADITGVRLLKTKP